MCEHLYKQEEEEIKSDKEKFIELMEEKYFFDDVHEFADYHFQNLLTMEENISYFKDWLTNKQANGI